MTDRTLANLSKGDMHRERYDTKIICARSRRSSDEPEDLKCQAGSPPNAVLLSERVKFLSAESMRGNN